MLASWAQTLIQELVFLVHLWIAKGLVPFTQLVKVRRESLFWYFRASDFHETFTRSSLALNMSRKLLLDPLGTLLGPSDPFWTVSNKNWYFAPKHLCQPLLCPFGAKKSFLSKMVQKGPDGPKMGPKWSKTFRLTILVPFGPFWTTLECWQACHVWPFLIQIE